MPVFSLEPFVLLAPQLYLVRQVLGVDHLADEIPHKVEADQHHDGHQRLGIEIIFWVGLQHGSPGGSSNYGVGTAGGTGAAAGTAGVVVAVGFGLPLVPREKRSFQAT